MTTTIRVLAPTTDAAIARAVASALDMATFYGHASGTWQFTATGSVTLDTTVSVAIEVTVG